MTKAKGWSQQLVCKLHFATSSTIFELMEKEWLQVKKYAKTIHFNGELCVEHANVPAVCYIELWSGDISLLPILSDIARQQA